MVVLKNDTEISPCCKKDLHFQIWNGLRLRVGNYFPCICSKCKKEYKVRAKRIEIPLNPFNN